MKIINNPGITHHVAAVCIALLATMYSAPLMAAVVDYQRTVVVSPIGGAPVAHGTELLDAIAAASAASPSANAPYLIKVEPGIYDVGDSAVVLPAHVDLEGSGVGSTEIRGVVDYAYSAGQAVIVIDEGSEVRQLTVVNNISNDTDSAALLMFPGSQANDVRAVATGSYTLNRALLVVENFAGSNVTPAKLQHVTLHATQRAAGIFFPGIEAVGLDASGNQGLLASSGTLHLRNSRVQGNEWSVVVDYLVPSAVFVATQIDGKLDCPSENCLCVHSYDGNFNDLMRSCAVRPGLRPF